MAIEASHADSKSERKKTEHEAASEQNSLGDIGLSQRDLVNNFCKEYAIENGFTIRGSHDNLQNDYQDVTGEKMFLTVDELNEMESVIYSISFGKQTTQKRITYQAFSAAIS